MTAPASSSTAAGPGTKKPGTCSMLVPRSVAASWSTLMCRFAGGMPLWAALERMSARICRSA